MNRVWVYASLIFLIFAANPALAEGPVFTLKTEKLKAGTLEPLAGSWWFAWDQHLTPEQAFTAYREKSLPVIPAPAYWNDHLPDLADNPYAHGNASYLARITLSGPYSSSLSLNIPRLSEAYRILWIPLDAPDQWVEVANEGSLRGTFQPALRNLNHPLPPLRDGLLLITVRKQLFYWGGLVRTLSIGKTDVLAKQKFTSQLQRGLLIGALIFVFFQNFLLYLYSKRDNSALLLAGLSLVIVIRSLFLTNAVEVIFGEGAHALRVHLEYITVLLPGALVVHFHKSLIPGFIHPLLLKGIWIVAIAGSLLTLVLPDAVMTDHLRWYQAFLGFNILTILTCLLRAVWLDLKYARLISLGSLIILFGGANDVLSTTLDTYNFVFSDYAMILFMFFQSQVVGRRIYKAIGRSKQLIEDKKNLEIAHRDAVETSLTDHLTGLLNRQALDARYDQAWDRMMQQQRPLSVVLFDIDHFKKVNDVHGHQLGDEVLVSVAALLRNFPMRRDDFVCRYGGEEFVLVLPATKQHEAAFVADKIRVKIMNAIAAKVGPEKLFITCSFGVAGTLPEGAIDPKSLIKAADDALYDAKKSGRNCVVQYGQPVPSKIA